MSCSKDQSCCRSWTSSLSSKQDFAPKPELLTVLRKEILPSLTILSATVPEVKALLDEAGVAVDYPKSVQDVLTMANALRSLGPEYVIIKREILEDDKRMSLLHYVLCGGTEPLTATSRVENSKGFFGASYSIPRKHYTRYTTCQNAPRLTDSSRDCCTTS